MEPMQHHIATFPMVNQEDVLHISSGACRFAALAGIREDGRRAFASTVVQAAKTTRDLGCGGSVDFQVLRTGKRQWLEACLREHGKGITGSEGGLPGGPHGSYDAICWINPALASTGPITVQGGSEPGTPITLRIEIPSIIAEVDEVVAAHWAREFAMMPDAAGISRTQNHFNRADQLGGVEDISPQAGTDCAPDLRHRIADLATALERLEGDTTLLRDLIHFFMNDSKDLRDAIRDAIGRDAGGDLQRAAHRLKGLLENLEAEDAANAAFRLESMGRDRDLSDAMPAFAELEKWIIRVESYVQSYLGRESR